MQPIRGGARRSSKSSLARGLVLSLLVAASFAALWISPRHNPAPDLAASRARAGVTLAELSLGFEQNVGQTDNRVRYLARAPGYTLYLTESGAVLSLSEPNPGDDSRRGPGPAAHAGELRARPRARRTAPMRIGFVGANPAPRIAGLDPLPGRVSYIIGQDPKRWRSGVATYGRVRYRNVYPGIDLVFYGSRQALECDFVVAPGANPDWILLSLEGGNARIDESGDAVLDVAGTELTLRKPTIYQQD